RRDADHLVARPDEIGEAHVVDLGKFRLKLAGNAGEIIGRDGTCRFRRRRQSQGNDGDIVDPPPDNQRLRDPYRDAVHIGTDLLMHAKDGRIRRCADKETRGDKHMIVIGPRIDMLDPVDPLDDHLKRFGHQLDRILRPKARRLDRNIDHGHGDLRLFLPRQGREGDETESEGRDKKQWRQRRRNKGAGERTGDAEPIRWRRHGSRIVSPGWRPVRISTWGIPSRISRSPGTTARKISPPGVTTRTKSRPERVVRALSGTSKASRTPTGISTRTRASTNVSSSAATSTSAMTRPLSICG